MRKALMTAAILLIANLAAAQTPQLADPFLVRLEGGTVLDVEGRACTIPHYADFDGDGVPDLLVGQYLDGACRIYHNYGSVHEPVFRDFEYFVADGKQASIPPT